MHYNVQGMFRQKVSQYIERERLFAAGDKLLVALSGGADSVALLRVLLSLGYPCEAVHCNFHLRGEESDRDERFVRTLCDGLQVPLHVKHFDTTACAKERHLSIEMAARELRYAYFGELAQAVEAKAVAVAHHRNDSVETFLLNLIRGTGLNGLCGIRAKNGMVVRPLLCVTRKEITDYLAAMEQTYVTDSTNLQDEYTRNKIRLHLLPLLESINPSVQQSIVTLSERLTEVAGIYRPLMEEGKRRVISPSPDGGGESFTISIPLLQQESAPQSLLFEILYPLGFHPAQIKTLYEQLDGESGRQFAAKEWRVLKDRTTIWVAKIAEPLHEEISYTLPEEGSLTLCGGMVIKVTPIAYTESFVIPREKRCACLDADKLDFPLTVRRWKQGDKFVPFGMKGTKALSDYMTDRKFTLWQKEQQWVVCSGDKIVWLVGERPDNRFRIGEATSRLLCLTLSDKAEA